MTKSIILGDLHFGVNQGSKEILEIQMKFFEDQVFPYMKKNNIKTIFQLGDAFDNRSSTDNYIVNEVQRRIFDYTEKEGITWHILLGNHDLFFKNSLSHSILYLFNQAYSNINLYSKSTLLEFDNKTIQIEPWLLDNKLEINKQSDVVLGHFEIVGFNVSKTYKATHGLDTEDIPKNIPILSGHFHNKQLSGNISYLGTPIQLSWSDYEEEKGFYVYDGDWNDLDFIENNEFKHLKVDLDIDTKEIVVNGFKTPLQLKYSKNMDLSIFKNNKVKLYAKKDLAIVKTFLEMLKEVAYRVDLEILKEVEDLDVNDIVEKVKGYDIEDSIIQVVDEDDRQVLSEVLHDAKELMKG